MLENEQLESHFLNLYKVALSDSEVDTQELELLYNLGKDRGISNEKIDSIIDNPHKVRFSLPDSVFEKIDHLYDFASMVLADDQIDAREIEVFKKLCRRYNFKKENISHLIEFLLESAKEEVPKDEIFDIVQNNITEG